MRRTIIFDIIPWVLLITAVAVFGWTAWVFLVAGVFGFLGFVEGMTAR